MNKKYQTNEIDTSLLAVPGQVSVAMDEIAADLRETADLLVDLDASPTASPTGSSPTG